MKDQQEFKAKIGEYDGVTRGKIPAPVVTYLGAKPGDNLVFHCKGKREVTVTVERQKEPTKKAGVNQQARGGGGKKGAGKRR